MSYHLFFGRRLDPGAIEAEAEAKEAPRHLLVELAKRLDGAVHFPTDGGASATDKLRSKLVGTPQQWAVAREVAARASAADRVYCHGEDIGIPVAVACGAKGRDRPKVIVYVNNVDRPRGRAALKMFGLAAKVDLFTSGSTFQVDFLRSYLKLPADRVILMEEHTDTRFFTPGPPSAGKGRKVVASVGLEKRDYRTLAAATADLDVDVRISGFSRDAAVMARSFPEILPANMSRKFYEWPDLVQLYRDADVVAVSLFPTRYAAGITTLLEGFSTARPVAITRVEGLDHYLRDPAPASVVAPGDPAALRAAIVNLLDHPEHAEAMARRGHELALARFGSDRYADRVAGLLVGL